MCMCGAEDPAEEPAQQRSGGWNVDKDDVITIASAIVISLGIRT